MCLCTGIPSKKSTEVLQNLCTMQNLYRKMDTKFYEIILHSFLTWADKFKPKSSIRCKNSRFFFLYLFEEKHIAFRNSSNKNYRLNNNK